MSAVDTSIYGGLLGPQRNALDYANEYAMADARRNQNALQRMQLDQAAQANDARGGIRNALAGLGPQATLEQQIGSLRSLGTPEALTQADALDTANTKRIETASQSRERDANAGATTFKTQVAKANQAITDISALSSPQEAVESLKRHLAAGDLDEAKAQGVYASLQGALQDPSQFGAWQRKMILSIMDAKDRIAATAPKVTMADTGGSLVPVNTNADAGAVGPVGAPMKVGVSPNTAYTQAQENARHQQSLGAMNARQGEALAETTRHNQAVEAGKTARDVPQTIVTAYVNNQAALQKIDDALAAVETGGDAFGMKNYLGDAIMQRMDQEGVGPRAVVADIGSLKIHDRSGAAVTVGESGRLKPFIPTATDSKEAIKTKLENLRNEYVDKNSGMESYYTPDMGFKPLPQAPQRGAKAKPAAGGWKVEEVK